VATLEFNNRHKFTLGLSTLSTATPVYDDSGLLHGVLSIDTHIGVFLNLTLASLLPASQIVSGSDEFHQLNARLNTLVHMLREDTRSLRDELHRNDGVSGEPKNQKKPPGRAASSNDWV